MTTANRRPGKEAIYAAERPFLDEAALDEMRDTLTLDRFRQLLQRFISDSDRAVSVLPNLFSRLEADEAGRLLHMLAGSAATFHAERFHSTLTQAEVWLRSSKHQDYTGPITSAITEVWLATRKRLVALLD
jgi:HPt (histidine-containing phosphotransfer) domain-containing protein